MANRTKSCLPILLVVALPLLLAQLLLLLNWNTVKMYAVHNLGESVRFPIPDTAFELEQLRSAKSSTAKIYERTLSIIATESPKKTLVLYTKDFGGYPINIYQNPNVPSELAFIDEFGLHRIDLTIQEMIFEEGVAEIDRQKYRYIGRIQGAASYMRFTPANVLPEHPLSKYDTRL